MLSNPGLKPAHIQLLFRCAIRLAGIAFDTTIKTHNSRNLLGKFGAYSNQL